MNKPYYIITQSYPGKCCCSIKIDNDKRDIFSSFELPDEFLAIRICDELNKAYEAGYKQGTNDYVFRGIK